MYIDPDGQASILQRTINDSKTNKAYHLAHVIGDKSKINIVLHGLVDRGELGDFDKQDSVWQYSGAKSGFTTDDKGSQTNEYIIRYSGLDDSLVEEAFKKVLSFDRFGNKDNEKAKENYTIFKNDCNAFTKSVMKEYQQEWKSDYKAKNPEASRKDINKAWKEHYKEIKVDQGKVYNSKTNQIED